MALALKDCGLGLCFCLEDKVLDLALFGLGLEGTNLVDHYWSVLVMMCSDLESCLKEASSCRLRLIATDGVFSMDGNVAPLKFVLLLLY